MINLFQIHFRTKDNICGCSLGHDLGIPCPFTIRLIKIKQAQGQLIQSSNQEIDNSILNNNNLHKFISKEWLVETHKLALRNRR